MPPAPSPTAAGSHHQPAHQAAPAPASPKAAETSRYDIHELAQEHSPDLVYFSSASENTRRFVERLNRPAVRIPLRPRRDGMIRVCAPYVLVVPTYGGGAVSGAVPKQVIHFLNDPTNRKFLRGVITSGNTNFGQHYCLAGPIIAAKCHVPELYRFELLGTQRDIDTVAAGLDRFWQEQDQATTQPAAMISAAAAPAPSGAGERP